MADVPISQPNSALPALQSRDAYPIYTIEGVARELRQGEIITNLRQYVYDPVTGDVSEMIHEYAVILAQDCDLLWDFDARERNEPGEMNGALIYELEAAPKSRGKISGSDIWKRIRQNKDSRYHVLEAVPLQLDLEGKGLPDLVIDFKRHFTLPPLEIYRQIASSDAQRRSRLQMPYREDLQSRAAFYLQRVSLPLPIRIADITAAAKK